VRDQWKALQITAEIGASFWVEILSLMLSANDRTLESEAKSSASIEYCADFTDDAIARSLVVFSSLADPSRTAKTAKYEG